jgi:hypothetical protein
MDQRRNRRPEREAPEAEQSDQHHAGDDVHADRHGADGNGDPMVPDGVEDRRRDACRGIADESERVKLER